MSDVAALKGQLNSARDNASGIHGNASGTRGNALGILRMQ